MSQNPSKPPPQETSSQINQTATGDDATQIGQVFGDVAINYFRERPRLFIWVLIFAGIGILLLAMLCAFGGGIILPSIISSGQVSETAPDTPSIISSASDPTFTPTQVDIEPQINPTNTPIFTPIPTNTSIPTSIPTPMPTSTNTPTPQCIVVANTLNLRDGPGTIYDPPIGKLANGTVLTPIGRDADRTWLQVQVQGTGQVGWVSYDVTLLVCNDLNVDALPVPPIPLPSTSTPTLVPPPTLTSTPIPPPPTPTPIPPLPTVTPTLALPSVTFGPWSWQKNNLTVTVERVEVLQRVGGSKFVRFFFTINNQTSDSITLPSSWFNAAANNGQSYSADPFDPNWPNDFNPFSTISPSLDFDDFVPNNVTTVQITFKIFGSLDFVGDDVIISGVQVP